MVAPSGPAAREGSLVLLLPAILGVGIAPIGFLAKKEALRELDKVDPASLVNAGEARQALETDANRAIWMSVVPALILLALYAWSRRSPFPTLMSALGLFLLVEIALIAHLPQQPILQLSLLAIVALVARGVRGVVERPSLRWPVVLLWSAGVAVITVGGVFLVWFVQVLPETTTLNDTQRRLEVIATALGTALPFIVGISLWVGSFGVLPATVREA
jgi:hypothetical protein